MTSFCERNHLSTTKRLKWSREPSEQRQFINKDKKRFHNWWEKFFSFEKYILKGHQYKTTAKEKKENDIVVRFPLSKYFTRDRSLYCKSSTRNQYGSKLYIFWLSKILLQPYSDGDYGVNLLAVLWALEQSSRSHRVANSVPEASMSTVEPRVRLKIIEPKTRLPIQSFQ